MSVLALLLCLQPSPWEPLLKKHCGECHGGGAKKGELDLDSLSRALDRPEAFAGWVRVYERIRDGEMPPKTKVPPEEAKKPLETLAEALAVADRARQRLEGRAAFRRLTRTEYENTLRDLLGLPGLEIRDLLPIDGRVQGFDKVSDALDVSSVHLAKYMEAADFALDRAVARTPEPPKVHQIKGRLFGGVPTWFNDATVPIRGRKADPEHVKAVRKGGYEIRPKLVAEDDTLGILTCPRPAFCPQLPFRAAESGWYRVRLTLWAFHWKAAEVLPARRIESVALSTGGRLLGYFDAPAEPKTTEKLFWLNAGDKIDFAAANLWPHFGDPITYEGPGVGLDGYEVEGPIHDAWPPVGHRRLFGDHPIEPHSKDVGARPRRPLLYPWEEGWSPVPDRRASTCTVTSRAPGVDAQRLLADFLPRAFRRPVVSAEVDRYVGIALDRLERGACFEDALRAAYKAALCSPDFLYLRETSGALGDHALACRLSYFLWGSMPDDALRSAADEGRLRSSEQLLAQVERMLRDPKSERFVIDFLDQWLDLRAIDFTSPDAQLYPEFRPDLKDAMLAETRAFFRELLDRDLGTALLAHSDFAMLNQRLAEHYGVPGVEGVDIRRVALPAEIHRGGLLTQGSVLKVTADGTTTSPVKRGAWIMDRLVGRPPAPPPPGIPGVDPDVRGTTTLREQLAKHRSEPTCSACHAGFDPPGFALESFDVIGGWRTHYRATSKEGVPLPAGSFYGSPSKRVRFRPALPVDPSGVLATGEAFRDIDDFKKLLLRDPGLIANNLAGRLLVYATGAPLGFADRRDLEERVRGAAGKGYGLRTLLNLIVSSPAFRNK
jgi:hypothetical protein